MTPESGEGFFHYQHNPEDPTSLSNERVISLHEDVEGALWVGTYIGLNKFDKKTGKFIRYTNDPADHNSLSDNRIWAIYEAKDGIFWLGTNGGLNRNFSF